MTRGFRVQTQDREQAQNHTTGQQQACGFGFKGLGFTFSLQPALQLYVTNEVTFAHDIKEKLMLDLRIPLTSRVHVDDCM